MNAGFTYNLAKSSWDWNFSERASLLAENNSAVLSDSALAPGAYAGVDYDTWEQNNNIDSYSDLSYQQFQFTLGGTYNHTENCYTTASVTYDIFDSNEKYVYGDEDGDAYYAYLGFGYRF